MTRFDKFRIRSLFNYYWTKHLGHKIFIVSWLFFAVLASVYYSIEKHPAYLVFLVVWGLVLVALSSNLNPAWRASRIELRAVHNSGKAPEKIIAPRLLSKHESHKWGNIVGHAERKRYGRHRIRKCHHCGSLELMDTNNFIKAWVKDGMVLKKEPLCQVWK